MHVLIKAREETEILARVSQDASVEEIRASLVEKAEGCIDHLCGCN